MAKVKVGDLVCMYRRKNKGMGIVLEHTHDIIEKSGSGISFEEFMLMLEEAGNNYNKRRECRKNVEETAEHPDMVHTCVVYNAGWAKKPKKEFVRVRWFDAPSLYETNKITEEEQWCPIDWLRKI